MGETRTAGIHVFGGAPPLPIETSGKVFYVGSTAVPGGVVGVDAAQLGDRPQQPYATIDFAIGQCVANRGDTVIVLPGHLETVTAANGLDLDVAGVRVHGLGWGLSRPQVNFTTAVGANCRLNANSVWVENLRFTGGIDNLTNVIVVNGVTDCVLRNIEYRDVTGQAAIGVSVANNSDRLLIDGFRYLGDSAVGTTRAIQLNGADDFVLRNFYIYGNFSTSAIDMVTTLSARVYIRDGLIWTENAADLCINDTITGSTGTIGPNLYLVLQDNAANITEAVTGAAFQVMDDVYVVNAVNEKAMLINWTASTDAIV